MKLTKVAPWEGHPAARCIEFFPASEAAWRDARARFGTPNIDNGEAGRPDMLGYLILVEPEPLQ